MDLDELCQCGLCGALHFDIDGRCPDCRAGWRNQCSTPTRGDGDRFTVKHLAAAFQQEAERFRKRAAALDAEARAALAEKE